MQEVNRRVIACVTLVMSILSTCHASTNTTNEQATYDQRQQGDLNVHVHVSDIGILALLDESLFGEYGQYDYSYDYSDPVDPENEDNNKPSNSTTSTESVTPTSATTTSISSNSTSVSNDNESSSTTQTSVEGMKMNQTTESANTTDCDCPSTTTKATTTTTTKITKTTLKPKPKNGTTIAPTTPVSAPTTQATSTTGPTPTIGDATKVPEDPTTTPRSLLAMLLPVMQPEEGVKKQSGRRRCGPGYVRDNRGRCRRVRKPNYQVLQRLPFELPFGIRLSPRPSMGELTEQK